MLRVMRPTQQQHIVVTVCRKTFCVMHVAVMQLQAYKMSNQVFLFPSNFENQFEFNVYVAGVTPMYTANHNDSRTHCA